MRRVMAEQNGLKPLIQAFVRYLFAGGIAFIVDFSALMFFNAVLGVNHLIASGIGFCFGLLVTYLCCNTFVFKQRKMEESPKKEFSIFAIIGGVGLLLTLLFMWLFKDILGWLWSEFGITQLFNYMYALVLGSPMQEETCVVALSKILTEGLVLLWNFGARKIILY